MEERKRTEEEGRGRRKRMTGRRRPRTVENDNEEDVTVEEVDISEIIA